jgi:actin-related protein
MGNEQVHICLDNGTGFMKGGFSGEEAPRSVFPTLVGMQTEGLQFTSDDNKPKITGQEALAKLGISKYNYPIENGVITDFDDMEFIWKHMLYSELKIVPENHNIILTDIPKNKDSNREKITQIFFEKFNVPGLFIGSTSAMSIYSCGKTNGIVIDSGESLTNFVPIYEGFSFNQSIRQVNIGGKDLTDYLIKILINKRFNIDNIQKKQIINQIKEKYCYCSYDFETEIREEEEGRSLEKKFKLPDGEEVTIEFERLKTPEILFNNNLLDKKIQFKGLHGECYDSIQSCDLEMKKDLYSNIILAGGNTLFKGLPERLHKEIQKVTPSALASKVKIIALPERKYAAWIGESILSSLINFQCMWITKAEYGESGSNIVHKKCF